MAIIYKRFFGGLFVLLMVFMSGCVALKPYPNKFQAGDTITLSIGSLDNATKDNITVTYYDDLDTSRLNPIDLTSSIRTVFKLYPDKTSWAWNEAGGLGGAVLNTIPSWSGHGPWLTVVALDLPNSTVLSAGTGVILVQPDAAVIAPNSAKLVENIEIPVEILPGDGAKDLLRYYGESFSSPANGPLGQLKPLPQVVVKPANLVSGQYGGEVVAAAEYVLNIPITDTATVPDSAVRVFWDDRPGDAVAQIQLSWARTGDTLKVNVISPTGNFNTGVARFSVILAPPNTYTFAGTPSLVTATYYGIDGAPATGTDPEVVLMYQ